MNPDGRPPGRPSVAARIRPPLGMALLLIAGYGANAQTPSHGSVIGVWEGTYTCAQGLTGITLTISQASPDRAQALFHFYADPRNPRVPTGCFSMAGSYQPDRNELRLVGKDWIMRPSGYVTVDFDGTIDALGSRFTGTVKGSGCTTFDLTRSLEAPDPSGPCRLDLPIQEGDIDAAQIATALDAEGRVDLNILFEFDRADLLPEAEHQLDELGRLLASDRYSHQRIGVYGHTDAKGSADYNLRLSRERAQAVARYLQTRFGLSPERLVTAGLGASRLKQPDAPFDAINRRVEIALMSDH